MIAYLTANKHDARRPGRLVRQAGSVADRQQHQGAEVEAVQLRRPAGHQRLAVSATYAGVRGVDQLTLNWANFALNPNGTCCNSFDTGAHGFSNFIYSTNDGKTWYDALQIQVDRPYRRTTRELDRLGRGPRLHVRERSVQGMDNLGDLFEFPKASAIPKHPSTSANNALSGDEKHRLVFNGITDLPYLWGIQFSRPRHVRRQVLQDVGCTLRFCSLANQGQYERGGFTVPGTVPVSERESSAAEGFPQHPQRAGDRRDARPLQRVQSLNLGCYDTGDRPARRLVTRIAS